MVSGPKVQIRAGTQQNNFGQDMAKKRRDRREAGVVPLAHEEQHEKLEEVNLTKGKLWFIIRICQPYSS